MVPVVHVITAPLLSPQLTEQQQAAWPGARGTVLHEELAGEPCTRHGRTFTARPEHGLVPSHVFPPDRLEPM